MYSCVYVYACMRWGLREEEVFQSSISQFLELAD